MHEGHRLALLSRVPRPLVPILVGLVVALERLVRDGDLREPLDGCDRVPAWHDQPQRIAVLWRQGLSVHLVGEQRACLANLVETESALEGNWCIETLDGSAIRSPELELRPARQCARPAN